MTDFHASLTRLRHAVLVSLLACTSLVSWAATKGPDAGGYQATDATVYSFIDVSGSGASVLSGTDDGTAVLTLPFPFQFYGHAYTMVCASSNGALYFIAAAAACGGFNDFANTDISATVPPGDLPSVLPFWSDLTFQVPGAGSVFYATVGAPGSRRFVVQWNNAYPQGSQNPVTFQLVLTETVSTILFQYNTVNLGQGNPASNGGMATVGIRNSGGPGNGQQIEWSYGAPVLSNSSALLFSTAIAPPSTTLTYTGATTGNYNDPATLSATLTATNGGVPISGKTVKFASTFTNATCSSVTNASGVASCNLTPSAAAGPYTVTATFTADSQYAGSTATATFTVGKEETTISFTAGSPTLIPNGRAVTLSATLLEDGTTPLVPAVQTVTFTLGTGTAAQTCSGTTNAAGLASCTVSSANQPLGPTTVAVNFAGDSHYPAASASEPVILFAFLSQGSMIVGNGNTATGTAVEFWGSDWSAKNTLSGGAAPSSFKGFADNSQQTCGGTWSTKPGNSSKPPDTLPSYMGVVASSAVTQSGSTISGDGPVIVVVSTNPGYDANPGHPGTGTVIATYCH
jgi:hypothetical protein